MSLAVESQPPGLVLLQPASEATVTIMDGDGKTVIAKLLVVQSLIIITTITVSPCRCSNGKIQSCALHCE